ncbi:MAG: ornithine cyclodeaminase family protein [Firmicutes bacterium]|nr:ornithine cyclodeaminase family protein [Bacillota bacterium]
MQKVTFRYLSQEDILKVRISYEQIIDTIEKTMAAKGRDMVECPPKPGIHTRHDTFIHAMPAFVKDRDICGMKWVCGYPDNYKYDLPQIAGLIIYSSPETGMPLAVMDCRWVTAVRTAAVSAVTTKYCKPKNTKVLTIIGAGVQGRFHAIMLKIVAPEIEKIFVTDIKPGAAEKLAADLKDVVDAEIIPTTDVEGSVRAADIVLTATQRVPEPIVHFDWIQPGTLGLALEASRAWDGKSILGADKYITDDWDLTVSYKAQGAFPDGLPKNHNTLGKIIIGEEPGREHDEDFILAINEGMAISDIALAADLYEAACEQNIGIELPLMEEDSIF